MAKPGFRSGKGNPYNQLKRQLDEANEEIARLRELPRLQEFARELADSILFVLSQKPMRQWPPEAVVAFLHESRGAPVLAEMYKRRLPK